MIIVKQNALVVKLQSKKEEKSIRNKKLMDY